MDEFDFTADFASEEEMNDELDAILLALGDEIESDESRTSVLNPVRMRELLFTYKAVKYLARGSSAKVSYKLHQPFQSMGSVSVTGKDILVRNPVNFIRAAKFASNIEVYPKTDGTVCMTFTFHGLTVPIE